MPADNKLPPETKDKELRALATEFLNAYSASAQSGNGDPASGKNWPFSLGAGGIIEITEEISQAQSKFVMRAASLLKSKAAHEKAISKIATDHAHDLIAGNKKIEVAVTDLIKAVFEHGNASFAYLAPNYLVRMLPAVKAIRVGRVKVLRTDDFAEEWKVQYPGHQVQIIAGDGFSIQLTPKVIITMRPVCWIVNVDAAAENVEEEGKWLIDVAVSYLRLRFQNWPGHFPALGDVEPHPLRPVQSHREGVKFQNSRVLAGGGTVPPWYEIDSAIAAATQEPNFVTQASLIFDPPAKSLAERVSQGLGWLSRGRQAEDRAERLLYFFTAIEALLSNDDKTAPVVQTIARHAAVLLTNDNAARAVVAGDVKKLYTFRSTLVHAGNRSVLWSGANGAQVLAERLFSEVLEKADLSVKHDRFCTDLAAASYGTAWPFVSPQS